ncbi:MAG: hypothetical protein IJB50_03730, partial [Clostridia bacterium]|nr:hypothetical protein [Clostridia bacterium]
MKKYYHKTVVVKDVFSGTLVYTLTITLLIVLVLSVLGRFDIRVSNSYVIESFKEVFAQQTPTFIEQKNIYDLFSKIIPLVKSSDEMMKKYEAFYGGVRNENLKTEPSGFLDGKNSEVVNMAKNGIVFNNATTYPMNLEELKSKTLEFSSPA